MLVDTLVKFIASVPTATGTDWNALQPFVIPADVKVKSELTGDALYAYIIALAEGHQMKASLNTLISLIAYHNAIPFVDLLQTNTGFAVVNSTNLAPASKERVERLIAWCDNLIFETTDLLIRQFMALPAALVEWTKFADFKTLTSCIFISGIDFANFVKVEGEPRKAYMARRNDLLAWQSIILQNLISADYLTQLVAEIRTNTFTTGSESIIHQAKMILAKLVAGDEESAQKLLNTLSNVLDLNLTTYTAYAASDEYALKISPKYVNKATDTTFFFN